MICYGLYFLIITIRCQKIIEVVKEVVKMEKNDRRNIVIRFKVSQDEYEFIKKKAELSGAKNLSCYLRKMVITGMVINYNDETLNNLKKEIAILGKNVNQIAVRVNKTNQIYSDDIDEIKEKVDEMWQSLISIQSTLRCTKP